MLDDFSPARWIHTFNREANAPMRRTNRTLGYRPPVNRLKFGFDVA